jgi:hypothetical protein
MANVNDKDLYQAAVALQAIAGATPGLPAILAASPTLTYYASARYAAVVNGEAKVGALATSTTGVLNTN